MKKFILIFLFLFLILLFVPSKALAVIFFEDNFDDNSSAQWSPINGSWVIQQGRYGTIVVPRSTIFESLAGDTNWTNYIYEVEMYALSGADKNLIFRVSEDGRTKYGIHMTVGYGITLEKHIQGRGWDIPKLDYLNNSSFPPGNYKIKIVLDGRTIEVYINNILRIKHTDLEDDVIQSGKIGLRVGTGAAAPSEVYFDNVVVKSLDHVDEEEEREPIVVVPGHGSSWCLSAILTGGECDQWQMTPFIKVYDNLLATLENAGYERDQNLFVFHYDWRKRINNLADELSVFIEDKIADNEEALIIGHSMGGLVARSYLQKTTGAPVKKLLTVGSPHEGVPVAYPAWSGGEIWNDNTWQWLALQLLLQTQKKGFATNKEALRHFSPSTQDLLPVFNYLFKDNQEINVNAMTDQNDWLETLTATENLIGLNGNQQNTLSAIDVADRNWLDQWLGNWADGKPTGKRFSSQGDATVLLTSAEINGVPSEILNLEHGALISEQEAIEKIIDLLELNISEVVSDTALPITTPSLIFFLHSPANLDLENPPAGTIISQEDKLIIIPNAQAGQYELKLTGAGAGDYDLEVGQWLKEKNFWQTITDQISQGEEQTIIIDFDPDNPQENSLVDQSGDLNLSIAKTKIRELKNDVSQLNIRFSLKSRINYYLDLILRYLERNPNGRSIQSALSYLYQLRININQWQKSGLLDENQAVYLKNSLMEISGYLENSYVKLMIQSGQSASASRAQRDWQTANNSLSRLSAKVKNKTQAWTYQLAQEKLNQGQGKITNGEYFYSQILAYSARFLTLELSRL